MTQYKEILPLQTKVWKISDKGALAWTTLYRYNNK